jgi:hypothetical protein
MHIGYWWESQSGGGRKWREGREGKMSGGDQLEFFSLSTIVNYTIVN